MTSLILKTAIYYILVDKSTMHTELPLTPQIIKELSSGASSRACEELFGVKHREQELGMAYTEKINEDKLDGEATSLAAVTRVDSCAWPSIISGSMSVRQI